MTLYEFCDVHFQNLTVEVQTKFSVPKDAEMKAALQVLSFQRFFCKWLSVPKIFFLFFLVKIGVKKAPTSKLQQILDAQKKAAQTPAQTGQLQAAPDAKVLPN
jgi:hypothetical protein